MFHKIERSYFFYDDDDDNNDDDDESFPYMISISVLNKY